MAATALVQTRIDPELRERAAIVLERMGLTVSDAVRILLTRTANEGAPPIALFADQTTHDRWFSDKVREALRDPRPPTPHGEVEARFATRRAEALAEAVERDR